MFQQLNLFLQIHFSKKEVESANSYHYDGDYESLFVKLFLGPIWNFFLKLVPVNLSSHKLTFIALIIELFSFCYTTNNSSLYHNRLKYWVRVTNGVCTLLYQLFINLSRLQAIRNNTNSPLAQFLRYTSNGIAGIIEMLKFASAIDAYKDYFMFYLSFLFSINMFLSAWYEYLTQTFYLPFINGPNEGLFLLGALYIFLGAFPHYTHSLQVPLFENGILILFGVHALFIIFRVIHKCKTNHKIISNSILTLLPFLFTLLLLLINYHSIDPEYCCFYILVGFVPLLEAQQLVVGNVVNRTPRQMADYSLNIIWPLFLVPLVLEEDYHTFYPVLLGVILLAILFFDVKVVIGYIQGLYLYNIDKANARLNKDVAVDVMKVIDEPALDQEFLKE